MGRRGQSSVYILLSGFVIALMGIVLFLWLFFSNMPQMHQTTRNLYEHPFALSNAILQLKVSIYQIRSTLLFVTQSGAQSETLRIASQQMQEQQAHIEKNLHLIKQNFSGNIQQIRRLEECLKIWQSMRLQILSQLAHGRFDEVQKTMAQQSHLKFNEIVSLTEYVLSYANRRANQFVHESERQVQAQTIRALTYATLLLTLFFIVSVVFVARLRALYTQKEKVAFTDFVTGISNRRSLIAALEAELQRTQRYGSPFAFVIAEIDDLKKLHQHHGQAFVDHLLQNFCVQCLSAMRTSDVVGRLGSNKLGMLMPVTELTEASKVIARLRNEIDCIEINGHGLIVTYTASFGLMAVTQSNANPSVGQVIKTLDAALASSKKQGQNRVIIIPDESRML